jgi:ATP-dependent RNA helicase DeaD
MSFSDLHLGSPFLRALERRGYAQPTPVQALVLQAENRGHDLLVSAQTGSGKTIAFGLSVGVELLGERETFEQAGPPLGLIIAPTRELALQVQQELVWLYADTGAKVRACVGGMDPRREQRALAEGAHLVVGTPGRLCDHLDRHNLDLSHLKALVLDEADEMLDMGFRDELERILRDAPTERRTLLLSATIPDGIAELAGKYQHDALRLAANPPEQAHQDIEYRAHVIAYREREHAVVNSLRFAEPTSALVFCATRDAVNHLQSSLAERGFSAVAISGELTQQERVRALKSLRDGQARVLVATDVAARGLDLPALDLVIHADLPRDAQILQHRSGRTGRAGRKGVSVLLVPARFRRSAEKMLATASVKAAWTPVPTAEQIHALDQERLTSEIAAMCEESSEDDLAVAKKLLEERTAEQLASALVHQRRVRLPAPDELPETARIQDLTSRSPGAQERRPRWGDAKGPRVDEANGVWFRLNVGRASNADPRWLLPLLCRRGSVVKAEVGRIVILAKETRFIIARDAARRFANAVSEPDPKDPSIRIELVEGGPGRGRSERSARPVSRAPFERNRSVGPRERAPAASEPGEWRSKRGYVAKGSEAAAAPGSPRPRRDFEARGSDRDVRPGSWRVKRDEAQGTGRDARPGSWQIKRDFEAQGSARGPGSGSWRTKRDFEPKGTDRGARPGGWRTKRDYEAGGSAPAYGQHHGRPPARAGQSAERPAARKRPKRAY